MSQGPDTTILRFKVITDKADGYDDGDI